MTGGMEKNVIDLYTLQTHLKTVLEGAFPARLWVKAEMSAVKARPGGHCYMELSQSDGNGLVAKVTAIIWSSKFRFLAPYFESETGIPPSGRDQCSCTGSGQFQPVVRTVRDSG